MPSSSHTQLRTSGLCVCVCARFFTPRRRHAPLVGDAYFFVHKRHRVMPLAVLDILLGVLDERIGGLASVSRDVTDIKTLEMVSVADH